MKIIEKIGSGAFGVVYKAKCTKIDEILALKLFSHKGDLSRAKHFF